MSFSVGPNYDMCVWGVAALLDQGIYHTLTINITHLTKQQKIQILTTFVSDVICAEIRTHFISYHKRMSYISYVFSLKITDFAWFTILSSKKNLRSSKRKSSDPKKSRIVNKCLLLTMIKNNFQLTLTKAIMIFIKQG